MAIDKVDVVFNCDAPECDKRATISVPYRVPPADLPRVEASRFWERVGASFNSLPVPWSFVFPVMRVDRPWATEPKSELRTFCSDACRRRMVDIEAGRVQAALREEYGI